MFGLCELSIVIVNWNGGDYLLQTLESLHTALDKAWAAQVILVDNASIDASVDRAEEDFPDMHIVRRERNEGFGVANNRAFEHARGQSILILNPDTIVQRAALSTLLEFMQTHPRAGMCGPKILDADGKRISPWCARRELFALDVFFEYIFLDRLFPRNRRLGRYTMSDWDHGQDRRVASLSGACMLVRRKALEQVGGFDERFFMYAEDLDWCRRFRRCGWQVWFVAGATIQHLEARCTRHVFDRGTHWAVQSTVLLFRKDGRRIDLIKVKLALSLGCLVRCAAWCGMGLRRPARWRYALGRSAAYFIQSLRAWVY